MTRAPTRVGYLGPEGTFSHEAALASGVHGELVALRTVHDVVVAVQDATVDRGLAPIENTLEGAVNATLDALAFDAPDVRIVGELRHPVELCLIADAARDLAEISEVASHPQPLGQCAGFLREHLPGAATRATTSTAEAVRAVGGPVAAIGPRAAAALYGAVVLRAGIEDEHGNETRFVWLSRGPADPSPAGAAIRTAVVFHGAGDASPGWLVRCLSEFAFRGVNLTMIESRPRKQSLGHYMFFADLEGRDTDPPVAGAIAGVAEKTEQMRVLGSYPAA